MNQFHKFKDSADNDNNYNNNNQDLVAAASTVTTGTSSPVNTAVPIPGRKNVDPAPRQQRRLTQPPQQRPDVFQLSDSEVDGSDVDLEAYLDATETADL